MAIIDHIFFNRDSNSDWNLLISIKPIDEALLFNYNINRISAWVKRFDIFSLSCNIQMFLWSFYILAKDWDSCASLLFDWNQAVTQPEEGMYKVTSFLTN